MTQFEIPITPNAASSNFWLLDIRWIYDLHAVTTSYQSPRHVSKILAFSLVFRTESGLSKFITACFNSEPDLFSGMGLNEVFSQCFDEPAVGKKRSPTSCLSFCLSGFPGELAQIQPTWVHWVNNFVSSHIRTSWPKIPKFAWGLACGSMFYWYPYCGIKSSVWKMNHCPIADLIRQYVEPVPERFLSFTYLVKKAEKVWLGWSFDLTW